MVAGTVRLRSIELRVNGIAVAFVKIATRDGSKKRDVGPVRPGKILDTGQQLSPGAIATMYIVNPQRIYLETAAAHTGIDTTDDPILCGSCECAYAYVSGPVRRHRAFGLSHASFNHRHVVDTRISDNFDKHDVSPMRLPA